ncbi:hypothetical protein RX717_08880 [Intestinibacillus sp. NTUH-41-i26]|uniref:hypothetical protein n=1 Tax=Intestinibacillus sp. NTUH-41-i26 TaxID=3079303 RepID=UPI002934AACA|nr:hypothetical protein [Intestinibacillus sp. NTUH-41-i26]WOC74141.1 hypothetical protein RX717_08880 [Intestinibacillus sp. NTUH-41-i26]
MLWIIDLALLAACVAELARLRDALRQAAAFEEAAKSMERRAAEEICRADRLAKALRESEDRLCEAMQTAETLRRASRYNNGMAREFANIFAFNGTEEGQADLTDG